MTESGPRETRELIKMTLSNEPRWTVVTTLVSPERKWFGTAWEFFDDEKDAERCYVRHHNAGNVPTKRPYYRNSDKSHLGESNIGEYTVADTKENLAAEVTRLREQCELLERKWKAIDDEGRENREHSRKQIDELELEVKRLRHGVKTGTVRYNKETDEVEHYDANGHIVNT